MDTPTLDLKTGLEMHQRGDLAGAESVYRSILEVQPDHAGAWHLLGLVSFAKKQYRQAKTEIQRALAVCDTKAVYWNNYGAVLRELGLAEEAKRACERALSIAPRYPDALFNLGLCLVDLGQLEPAREEFGRALEIQPDHGDSLKHLARVCRDLGRLDEAAACLRRVLERRPDDAEAWSGMGEVYLSGKRPTEAVDAFRRAIVAQPQNGLLRLSLGRAQHLEGNLELARASFAEAAQLAPERPIWRFRHLGYLPQVLPDEGAIDREFESWDQQLDGAIEAGFPFDWRQCLEDGFCPPFGLVHHGRCCRSLKEKFAALFAPHFPSVSWSRRGKKTDSCATWGKSSGISIESVSSRW